MTELRDEDRLFLELARDAHAPDGQDRARVRAALASRLGAAAGLGLTAAAAATTKTAAAGAGLAAKAATTTVVANGLGATGVGATAAVGAGAVAAKLIGAAVLAFVTVGAGATAIHLERRAHLRHLASPGSVRPAQPVRPTAPVSIAAAPAPADQPAPPAPPAEKKVVGRSHQPPATVAGSRQPIPARPLPTVAGEAGLIQAGVVARRSGQPRRALELFQRHALLYPHGVLVEERDAERALALADLGRTSDARAAIEEFLRAHPSSPLIARLRERQRLLELAPR